MKSDSHQLPPKNQKILIEFGTNLKMARLRRRFSRKTVAERAGISTSTLTRIEKGHPTVTIGAFLQVMHVLGMEAEIGRLGKDDELGRKIQDSMLITKARAPKRNLKKESHE
jgi:transcriptional regulator with XRE-family HTH domain